MMASGEESSPIERCPIRRIYTHVRTYKWSFTYVEEGPSCSWFWEEGLSEQQHTRGRQKWKTPKIKGNKLSRPPSCAFQVRGRSREREKKPWPSSTIKPCQKDENLFSLKKAGRWMRSIKSHMCIGRWTNDVATGLTEQLDLQHKKLGVFSFIPSISTDPIHQTGGKTLLLSTAKKCGEVDEKPQGKEGIEQKTLKIWFLYWAPFRKSLQPSCSTKQQAHLLSIARSACLPAH